MNVKKYGNFNLQCWVEATVVASLVEELEKRGLNVIPIWSQFLRDIVGICYDELVTKPFESTEEAILFLAKEGFSVTQVSDIRRSRTLRSTLRQEEKLFKKPLEGEVALEIRKVLEEEND